MEPRSLFGRLKKLDCMKKTVFIILVVIAAFVAGCDGFAARHINVLDVGPAGLDVVPENDAVLSVVRRYADDNNIRCDDNGKLPIECWRQPIRIWAMRTDNIVVVCYSAMVGPFEGGKFQQRMDRLQNLLQERFGKEAVSVSPEQCPVPPSSNQRSTQ